MVVDLSITQVKELRARRTLHPPPLEERIHNHVFAINNDFKLRKRLIEWLEGHTSGMFYVGQGLIYLYDAQDVTMFVLSDLHNKIKKGEL